MKMSWSWRLWLNKTKGMRISAWEPWFFILIGCFVLVLGIKLLIQRNRDAFLWKNG